MSIIIILSIYMHQEADSVKQIIKELKSEYGKSKMDMLKSGMLKMNGLSMNFTYQTKGQRPPNGYILIFGFHGGGGCPPAVNNSQFNNHKNLYNKFLPDGSIWFTPRSCEDVWDMWFKEYMEDFILQIIRAFVFNEIVDVNKVFLTGYSAGGDGVYHLAPRMADFLAGAAMMAGHPNGINLHNVRNIAFSIQVGGLDTSYNRNGQALKYIQKLDQYKKAYGQFKHLSKVHHDKRHWMQLEDAKIFPWLFSHQRNPYPSIILFKQCPRRQQKTFYYIRIGKSIIDKCDEETLVLKEENRFEVYSNRKITILINRKMVDPSKNVVIVHNGKVTHDRKMGSSEEIRIKTLMQRLDPCYVFEDEFQSQPPQVLDVESLIKVVLMSYFQNKKDKKYQKQQPEKHQLKPTTSKYPASSNFSIQPINQKPHTQKNQQPSDQTAQNKTFMPWACCQKQ